MLKPLSVLFSRAHTHWKLLAILIMAGGLLIWWFVTQQQTATPSYTFINPERGTITKTLEVSGFVDAREKARLRFAAGGKVVYLGAKEGDTVKRWQTIATIDRAALQKQLEQNLNSYMKERYDWEQVRDDNQDKALTDKDVRTQNKDQLDLNTTVLSVEIQDIAIKNTVLSAPFEGILTVSPTATTGIQLMSTDYFEIVNPASLEFIAEVDESDIAKVAVGQSAELILDAFPDLPISSTVQKIAFASSLGETGTVFEVTFSLDQSQIAEQLRLGMNGDVAIELDARSDTLIIPLTTTRQREGKTYVDVRVDEQTIAEREITIGLETDEHVEVLSGLQETDAIVSPE